MDVRTVRTARPVSPDDWDLVEGCSRCSAQGALGKRSWMARAGLSDPARRKGGKRLPAQHTTSRERALRDHTPRPATVLNSSCGTLRDPRRGVQSGRQVSKSRLTSGVVTLPMGLRGRVSTNSSKLGIL
jgi:hypothetical protein